MLAGAMAIQSFSVVGAYDKGPFVKDSYTFYDDDYVSKLCLRDDNYSKEYFFFKDTKTVASKLSGATYNLSTNTLTLKNVKQEDLILDVASMGDDFKLSIAGTCKLKGIVVKSDCYGASITITGKGKLFVNSSKELDYGISTYGFNSFSPKIRFGKKVTVTSLGKLGAVACEAMKDKNLSDAIKFDNGLEPDIDIDESYYRDDAMVSMYYLSNKTTIEGLVLDGSAYEKDTDGVIYLRTDSKVKDSEGNTVDGYKIVALKPLGDSDIYTSWDQLYGPDSYDGKTTYGYINMTKEDYENQSIFTEKLIDGNTMIMKYEYIEGSGRALIYIDSYENYYYPCEGGYMKVDSVIYGDSLDSSEDSDTPTACFIKEKKVYKEDELKGLTYGGKEHRNGYTYVYAANKLSIKPTTHKKTKIKKVVSAKKGFTVKWKKIKSGIKGYQIQYSTNKAFKKGNKTVLINKANKASKKIKSLKSKKTYYVRIRTYKMMSGQKCFSGWSKKVKVTTK